MRFQFWLLWQGNEGRWWGVQTGINLWRPEGFSELMALSNQKMRRSNSNTWSNTAPHHRARKLFPFISSPSDSRSQTHIQQANSQFFPFPHTFRLHQVMLRTASHCQWRAVNSSILSYGIFYSIGDGRKISTNDKIWVGNIGKPNLIFHLK